jgi:hypothetical protein
LILKGSVRRLFRAKSILESGGFLLAIRDRVMIKTGTSLVLKKLQAKVLCQRLV